MSPGADDPLNLRVTVSESWRVIPLTLSPGSPVAELKRRALEGAAISQRHASRYEVKFGGALVADETQRLDAVGIPDGAALVVLPRRRRPVR